MNMVTATPDERRASAYERDDDGSRGGPIQKGAKGNGWQWHRWAWRGLQGRLEWAVARAAQAVDSVAAPNRR